MRPSSTPISREGIGKLVCGGGFLVPTKALAPVGSREVVTLALCQFMTCSVREDRGGNPSIVPREIRGGEELKGSRAGGGSCVRKDSIMSGEGELVPGDLNRCVGEGGATARKERGMAGGSTETVRRLFRCAGSRGGRGESWATEAGGYEA